MDTDTQVLPVRRLRCDHCGWARDCSPTDLRLYAVIGPPACSGHRPALPRPRVAGVDPAPRARRRPARRGVVVLRRAGDPGGPDLAEGLVDLSADALGVLVGVSMMPGDEVEVALRAPGPPAP